MIKSNNRIIIVDNLQKELDTLGKSFFKNGLGCRTFLYSAEFETPLTGVRIAFFDINLADKTVDNEIKDKDEFIKYHSSIFNDLGHALNLYISKENGPYILIFWTSNPSVINGFVEYMQDEKRGFSDTPSPVFIGNIDKDDFLESDDEDLSSKVLDIINNDSVRFLLDFENTINISGENTINKLLSIIPRDESWGKTEVFYENFSTIFSKIAMSTLGFDYSKENPSKAINEGLLPLLNNEITQNSSKTDWKNLLKPLFDAKKFGDVKTPDNSVQNKVNTIFHIEGSNGEKDARGTLVKIDQSSNEILKTLNIDDLDDWKKSLLSIKDNKTELIKEINDKSELIALEISAACDFSNQKPRINKYILGLLTPIIDTRNDINSRGRIESSYHVGGCSFEKDDITFQIWLNLNFVFGCSSNDSRLGETKFVLKKEIMDMIGNKYASHISRIGITSF